jgi:hypothetical protein
MNYKLLVSRHSRICIYKTPAKPILSYDSESRTIRTDGKKHISGHVFHEDCRVHPLNHKRNDRTILQKKLERTYDKKSHDRIPK